MGRCKNFLSVYTLFGALALQLFFCTSTWAKDNANPILRPAIARWGASATAHFRTSHGTQEGKTFFRYAKTSKYTYAVGSVVYTSYAKAPGEQVDLKMIADAMRQGMGFTHWDVTRAAGKAQVYEADYPAMNERLQIFISERDQLVQFTVARARRGFSDRVLAEAELIQRQIAGELKQPSSRFKDWVAELMNWDFISTSAYADGSPGGNGGGLPSSGFTGDGAVLNVLEHISAANDDYYQASHTFERSFYSAIGAGFGGLIGGFWTAAIKKFIDSFKMQTLDYKEPKAEKTIQDFKKIREEYEQAVKYEKSLEATIDKFILAKLYEQKLGKDESLSQAAALSPEEGAQYAIDGVDQALEDAKKAWAKSREKNCSSTEEANLHMQVTKLQLQKQHWGTVLKFIQEHGLENQNFCEDVNDLASKFAEIENQLQHYRIVMQDMEGKVEGAYLIQTQWDSLKSRKFSGSKSITSLSKKQRVELDKMVKEAQRDLKSHPGAVARAKYDAALEAKERALTQVAKNEDVRTENKDFTHEDTATAIQSYQEVTKWFAWISDESRCVDEWRYADKEKNTEVSEKCRNKNHWNLYRSLNNMYDKPKLGIAKGNSRESILKQLCHGARVNTTFFKEDPSALTGGAAAFSKSSVTVVKPPVTGVEPAVSDPTD